jgi:hypothetical protein
MNDVIARLRGQAAARDTSQCRAEQSRRNRPGTAARAASGGLLERSAGA